MELQTRSKNKRSHLTDMFSANTTKYVSYFKTTLKISHEAIPAILLIGCCGERRVLIGCCGERVEGNVKFNYHHHVLPRRPLGSLSSRSSCR